jgi:ParB family transcriptional regulator, chromosome partitioning protein
LRIEEVDMDLIEPNREQPRLNFDEKSLAELRDSIKRNGIIQPIVLVKEGLTYRIVAGERRWRAAMELRFRKIPAVVREIDSEQEMEIAIAENIQRESLNSIEEALSFKRYLDKTGRTQEELSSILGKSRSYISNTIRLLKLPETIIEKVKSGKVSSGHGRTLLAVEDRSLQENLCDKVERENLSVRELENLISKLKKEKSKKAEKDIYTENLEQSLSSRLGRKVSIKKGNKKGKIEIEYYGDEELESIVDMISRLTEKA